MSEQQQEEKEEKQEKQEEKEEKEREEKSWEEKWRSDPVNAAAWAAMLIWAGLVLLAGNAGLLDRLEPLSTWNLIFAGAGVIVLLEAVVRLLMPVYRRPVVGTVIFGLILLAIGLGELVSWNAIWPLILIILGVSLLVRGLMRRR